jgi:hypothetical protein
MAELNIEARDAELHIGYAARPPLGHQPGIIVQNGLTHKDRVLCAAGPETRYTESLGSSNPRSVVLLLLRSRPDATARDVKTSTMRAAKVDGDKGVGFQLSTTYHRQWRPQGRRAKSCR